MRHSRWIRTAVLGLLLAAVVAPVAAQEVVPRVPLKEFRPFGGAVNNVKHPILSAVPGNAELALTPLNFAPGTRDGMVSGPNPRLISNTISGRSDAVNGSYAQITDPVLSAWLYVFGQFVDHDLELESTPLTNAPINIVVPEGDPQYPAGTTIAMTRATRSSATNTIINTVSSYLNLSQLYGQTAAVATSLENRDGTLKSTGRGRYLPIVKGYFVSGDPRVTENPELTATTTLFMREHNFWVATLRRRNPGWSAARLFGMAREITTAEYQNIIYTGYLPHLLGPVLGPYRGYDPMVNAQVSQEFATAAFRLHTQVSDTEVGLSNSGVQVFSESLAQAFFNSAATDEANGIDNLIRSIGSDHSQATDPYTVAVLRDLLNAGLVGGGKDLIDLMAIDIARERDVGLGTLNETRRSLGLAPYASFAQLTADPWLQANYAAVYGSINDVDLFMGGLAEAHAPGANVGPTFQAIIANQFSRERSGDRFFWRNEGFDPQTAAMIERTTLATIIRRNTDTTNLQADVFVQAAFPNYVKAHVRVRAR
jgi:hypothetical protein